MSEYQQYSKSPSDYINLIKRRKLSFVVPAVIIFLAAVVIALELPTIYQSKATILIEEQEIPRDFVSSTIANYAAQQVQVISQRLLTVESIKAIAEKFQLYGGAGSGENVSGSRLAQKFRNNMSLDLVDAQVVDPRSGRPTSATIAFTLSFNDTNPATAQKVTDELVTLFLNENLRDRTEQARSTADFLGQEAKELDAELMEVEQRLASFKAENEGSLPELYQFNLSILERSEREMSVMEQRIQELEKRRIEVTSQLSQLSPTAPLKLSSGDVVLSDMDRLKVLQSEYRRVKAIYRDNHPDVVRLEREISNLQNELGVTSDTEDLQQQLLVQQEHLSELQSKYNESHPEIASTRRIIAQLEKSIRNAEPQTGNSSQVVNNPAYVMLQTQLNATESELRSLQAREKELREKIDHHEALVRRAPNVEKEYNSLLRDYESVSARYQDIKAKQRSAAMSIALETEQRGERFTLIEPAALPIDPVSPNRSAIIYLGFVLAVGVGIGFVLLREALDSSIHSEGELAAITGEPALVVIPYIDNEIDIRKRQRALTLALAAAVAISLLLYAHLSSASVDDMYQMTLGKLG
jgi:uncharacterized protein involved in exopolysaccharide biosynthesis